jgi:hypothetical protein
MIVRHCSSFTDQRPLCPTVRPCPSVHQPQVIVPVETVPDNQDNKQCLERLKRCNENIISVQNRLEFENTSKLGAQSLYSECDDGKQRLENQVKMLRQQNVECRDKMGSRVELSEQLINCELLLSQMNETNVKLRQACYQESNAQNQLNENQKTFLLNQISNLSLILRSVTQECRQNGSDLSACTHINQVNAIRLNESTELSESLTAALNLTKFKITGKKLFFFVSFVEVHSGRRQNKRGGGGGG